MRRFIALFTTDFAKIGIEMNNEPGTALPVVPRQQSPLAAVLIFGPIRSNSDQKSAMIWRIAFYWAVQRSFGPKSDHALPTRKCHCRFSVVKRVNRQQNEQNHPILLISLSILRNSTTICTSEKTSTNLLPLWPQIGSKNGNNHPFC